MESEISALVSFVQGDSKSVTVGGRRGRESLPSGTRWSVAQGVGPGWAVRVKGRGRAAGL